MPADIRIGATREAFDVLCIQWGIEPVGSKVKRDTYITEPIF